MSVTRRSAWRSAASPRSLAALRRAFRCPFSSRRARTDAATPVDAAATAGTATADEADGGAEGIAAEGGAEEGDAAWKELPQGLQRR